MCRDWGEIEGEAGWLRTRRIVHPKGSDTRSLLPYLSKTFDSNGLHIVKAMLGRTLQEKQEDRALATGQAETIQGGRDKGVYCVTSYLARRLRLDLSGEES